MKASKALFAIGFIILVVGIIIAIVPTTQETWEHKEESLANAVLTVPGGSSLFPLPDLIFMPEGSRDIQVSGTVRELRGGEFDFYAFNKRNYELWVAKASYTAFVEVKDVSSYSLSFSPTQEDVNNMLYLVVVNKNPLLGPSISVEYSVKISWSERSYATVLGGLVLGGLLGGLGFLLIIVSAAMRFIFERRRGEETRSSSARRSLTNYRVASKPTSTKYEPRTQPRFCPYCRAMLAIERNYCGSCGRKIR